MSKKDALAIAHTAVSVQDHDAGTRFQNASLLIYPADDNFLYTWKANVNKWTVMIDAFTGNVLRKYEAVVYQNSGEVIAYERNSCNSIDTTHPIQHLDDTGYLKGDFFDVTTVQGARVKSLSHTYYNTPARGNKFAQQEIYYQLERAREYFVNLGFLGQSIAGQVVRARANAPIMACGAGYWFELDIFAFGTPDDDCARAGEDGDIIFHEYSHRVIKMAVGGDILDSGDEFSALNEAVADYFAASFFNDPCFAGPLDKNCATCLRNVWNNNKKTYDKDDDPHIMGLVLGGAMWDIRKSIGQNLADQIFLNGLYGLHKHSSFSDYAAIVLSETVAYFGDIDSWLEAIALLTSVDIVRYSFCQHGINVPNSYLGGCVLIDWWENKDFKGKKHTRILFDDEHKVCRKLVHNDKMKSIKFYGQEGQQVEIYDDKTCSKDDDWGVITFTSPDSDSPITVVEVPRIGQQGEQVAKPAGTYKFNYHNGLPGKVSAIRFKR